MEIDCKHFSATRQDRTTASESADDRGWNSLDIAIRFAVARLARGIWSVADGLPLFQSMERRWYVGQDAAKSAGHASRLWRDRPGPLVRRRHGRARSPLCRWRRKKGDPEEPSDHALGRSRGGFSTKIHILCDGNGHPLHFHLTPGQTHESTVLDTILAGADARLFDGEGQPVAWPVALSGDKGYRAEWIDQYLIDLDILPVIPSKENEDGDARLVAFDRKAYRRRNIVERLIGWLKEARRVFSRFEKTAKNFGGMLKMAFIHRYLRLAVETT